METIFSICEVTGVKAIDGVCPKHHGDTCLVNPVRHIKWLNARIERMQKSLEVIRANAVTHFPGGDWYYTEATYGLRPIDKDDF